MVRFGAVCSGMIPNKESKYQGSASHFDVQARFARFVRELSWLRSASTFSDERAPCARSDRNFLRVIMSRALVEPNFGKVLSIVGSSRHVPAFVERLTHFEQFRVLPEAERDGLAQSIKVLGLVFGFMRPALLGQDRAASQTLAMTIATMTVRGID